jgi:hypothetical protein
MYLYKSDFICFVFSRRIYPFISYQNHSHKAEHYNTHTHTHTHISYKKLYPKCLFMFFYLHVLDERWKAADGHECQEARYIRHTRSSTLQTHTHTAKNVQCETEPVHAFVGIGKQCTMIERYVVPTR